ncbi:MAG: YihY/virulence factor BrkB family protein [Solirubrobacterales bacterium]
MDLRAIWKAIKSAVGRIGEHNLSDWAAALTYYSMLSIFPGLLALFSVLGLLGESVTGNLVANFRELAPGPVRDIFISAIDGVQRSRSAATVFLIISSVTALYSASAYIGAFIRASNVVWGVREQRRFYQTIPLRIGITLLLLALLSAIGIAAVLTGPLTEQMAQITGFDPDKTLAWDILRWPALIGLAALALAVLYNLSPDLDDRRFKPITPGSLLAVGLWITASAGFTVYVSSFATYNKTYGSIAGIIVFLVWLWLTNMAVLLGLELDAELKRFREAHGHSPFRARRP